MSYLLPPAPKVRRDDAALPSSAEICANCWYFGDEEGWIYGLAIHLSVCAGTDEEKLAFLQSRAYLDYLVAQTFPLPKKFSTNFVERDGATKKIQTIHQSSLALYGGISELFFPWLDQLQEKLPSRCQIRIPESPLMAIHALTMDAQGRFIPLDAVR